MHIKKLGLKNFRIFKDYHEFDLAPITILTGQNNSGKSSFNKAILTLKEAFEHSGTLEWFDLSYCEDGLDSGENFLNYINFDKGNEQFTFITEIPAFNFDEPCQAEYTYRFVDGHNKFFLEKVTLLSPQGLKLIEFTEYVTTRIQKGLGTLVPELEIEELDVKWYVNNKFLIQLYRNIYDHLVKENLTIENNHGLTWEEREIFDNSYGNFQLNERHFELRKRFDSLIFGELSIFKHKVSFEDGFNLFVSYETDHPVNVNYNDILNSEGRVSLFRYVDYSNKGFFPTQLRDLETRCDEYAFYNPESKTGRIVFSNLMYMMEKEILWPVIEDLKKADHIFKGISYCSPRRVYRDSKGIDIIFQNFGRKYFPDNQFSDFNLFIQKAFELFNIPGKIVIEKVDSIYFAYLENDNRKTLLSNFGFGFTQLIPIILEIANMREQKHLHNIDGSVFHTLHVPKLFVLEEPESNLHPNLQSKLADLLFIAYKKYNIQFIVETHSEYLIRRLQYLIAKGEIDYQMRDREGKEVNIKTSQNDVVIYYFNPPHSIPEGEEQLKRITIKPNGGLTDNFGSGFFDEANNTKVDLLKLNRAQSN